MSCHHEHKSINHPTIHPFSSPDTITKYSAGVSLDGRHEVVLETRPFDHDISIETITKLCAIQNVDVDTVPQEVVQGTKRNRMMPYYVCRYKLIRSSHVKYVLVPVLGEIRVDKKRASVATGGASSAKKSSTTTASASKRKLVSPIKITRHGVEKLTRTESKESVATSGGSDIENVSPNKRNKRIAEIIVDSPRVARRNLNDSFGTEAVAGATTSTPDLLNYSIVAKKTPSSNELNICLRVSQRQKFTNPKYETEGGESSSSSGRKRRTSDQEETPHKTTPEKASRRSSKAATITTEEASASTPTTSRVRTRRASLAVAAPVPATPPTKSIATRRSSVTCTTPSTLMHPRRSILKTPSKGTVETTTTPSKKRLTLSHIVEEVSHEGQVTRTPTRNAKKNKTGGYYLDDIPATPESAEKKKGSGRTPSKKAPMTPSSTSKLRQLRAGEITPSITARSQPVNKRRSQLELARESLHVSALLKSLPCRETEFENVFHFVEGKLLDKCGGCMYISGESLHFFCSQILHTKTRIKTNSPT